MKLLLDENLPIRLKYSFSKDLEVATVNDLGWNAIKNGELLQSMVSQGFNILVTADRNLGLSTESSKVWDRSDGTYLQR